MLLKCLDGQSLTSAEKTVIYDMFKKARILFE